MTLRERVRQRLLSTNPTTADTSIPKSMLSSGIFSLVLACWRLETNCKAVFTCAEEAYDILDDIGSQQITQQLEKNAGQILEVCSSRLDLQ